MLRDFATSLGGFLDSGQAAVKAYTNSQYNRIDTQVTNDYNAFIDELQYDNDFEGYEQKVADFWAQESSKIKDGKYGSLATNLYLEKRMPALQQQMQTTTQSMVLDGCWRQAKVNYELAVQDILENDNLTYDAKMTAIQQEYDNDGMASFPLKLGTVKSPDQYSESIKAASIKNVFNSEMFVGEYADAYFTGDISVDEIFDKVKPESKIPEEVWTDYDVSDAKAYIRNALGQIEQQRKEQATVEQNKMTGEYQAKIINGETYTEEEWINDAISRGAMSADGTYIDPFWISYVAPHLTNYTKELETNEEIEELALTLDGLSTESIAGSAATAMGGTVVMPTTEPESLNIQMMTPARARAMQKASEQRSVYKKTEKNTNQLDFGSGVTILPKEGQNGSVMVNGQEIEDAYISEAMFGDRYVNDFYIDTETDSPELREAASQVTVDESGNKPKYTYWFKTDLGDRNFAMDENYKVPEEYPSEQGLSDVLASEMAKATEGTLFENAVTLGGDINYSNGYGKQTYKADGEPDFTCNYEPIVAQYCKDHGIDYSTKSSAVYAVAKAVQAMGDNGYFSDPNKSAAVQALSVARNDPKQAVTYAELAQTYVSQGYLTQDELKDYGLESSAYNVKQLEGTMYAQTLDYTLQKGFEALFGEINGATLASKTNNLTTDQKILWESVKDQMTKATQTAFYTDPKGSGEKYLDVAQEIIQKYADTAWTNQLYKELTGRNKPVRYSGTKGVRRYDENQNTAEILQSYFSTLSDESPMYAEFLDQDIVTYVTETMFPITTDINADLSGAGSGKATKGKLEEISQNRFSTAYDSLSPFQKNTVMFSYIYGRTERALKKEICDSFGYGYGEGSSVVIYPTDNNGGGFAVVTNDGRVYMAAGVPDGSGHKWYIGSVDNQTLTRIQSGLTALSYNDISYNGVYSFDDNLTNYGKEGIVVSGNKKDRDLKEKELNSIYRKLQPERFKY